MRCARTATRVLLSVLATFENGLRQAISAEVSVIGLRTRLTLSAWLICVGSSLAQPAFPFNVTLGPKEVVFDWSRDRCADFVPAAGYGLLAGAEDQQWVSTRVCMRFP